MEILISRAGETFGPYSVDTVNSYISDGSLKPSDFAWHKGLPDWIPLSEIPGVIIEAPPPSPQFVETPPPPPQTESSSPRATANSSVNGVAKLKKPWTASLLNLLVTGLGYGYLGLWGRAALIFAAAIAAAIFTFGIGYLVPLAFSLVDSFILANKINDGEAVDNLEGLDIVLNIASKFLKR